MSINPNLPSNQSRRQSLYHQQRHIPPYYQQYPTYQPQYHGQYQYPSYQPQHPPAFYHHYQPPPPPHHLSPQNHQHQQSPLVVSSHPQAQAFIPFRQSQQTPQPARTPLPEQSTPSTASRVIQSASTTPTTASISTPTPPISSSKVVPPNTSLPGIPSRAPFYPQLPWYSVAEDSFPARPRRRPRKRKPADLPSEAPEFPSRTLSQVAFSDSSLQPSHNASVTDSTEATQQASADSSPPQPTVTPPPPPRSETATPIPAAVVAQSAQTHRRAPTIPVVPIIPSISRRPAPQPYPQAAPNNGDRPETQEKSGASLSDGIDGQTSQGPTSLASVVPQKSWAELLRSKQTSTNGAAVAPAVANGRPTTNGIKMPKSDSLSDALRLYNVDDANKISFLEPRGLVNTGNMCYMNSILQVLVFCVPFFELLDRVGKRAAHNFKSSTPLIDAMILFIREYPVIDSASSEDQLRLRLKDGELEQYGEPFIPEYVYDAIKRLPRFSSMRRGQQQDAEEFLGLLLEVLHLECLGVMGEIGFSTASSNVSDVASDRSSEVNQGADAAGWMEVQHKQKPAITRSSGAEAESPITKVFGGKLRSEFRVSGNKNSVTLTPYQQLQLDIGDPSISNITDALKGLARSERVDGAFQTTRGTATSGTKQSFLETLPPVLILHLKRFHYEGNATQKIWKRIGYPLELDVPREVFTPSKRAQYVARPQGIRAPRYRLIGVVYHHGKHASGGHYTVDVRRQEGREWVRLDDTIIRRVRAQDVAGEGNEEDSKLLSAALEQHKREQGTTSVNMFAQAGFASDEDDKPVGRNGITNAERETDDAAGWSQVNGGGHTSPTAVTAPAVPDKKRAANSAVTGTGNATPSTSGKRTPREPKDSYSPQTAANATTEGKNGAKDNKVAYILFYQQIKP